MKGDLTVLRARIDAIDTELVALFEKRMEAARQVGVYKRERGLDVTDTAREEAVLDSRVGMLHDPRWAKATRALFTEMMRLSREEQQRG